MQISSLHRCSAFTTQRPKRSSHSRLGFDKFCSCKIGIPCQLHAGKGLQIPSSQHRAGCPCQACHGRDLRSHAQSSHRMQHRPGCSGKPCICAATALACSCRPDGFTCQVHSARQTCGCRADGFRCQAHAKPLAQGCGCRADGFRCQAHAKPLAQSCGCRADGFRCQAHAKPLAQTCGCRADGFRCQAHAKPLAQGCGCRADGFRCQAHAKPLAQTCACRADGFRCQAHTKPLPQGCGCRADGFRCQAHAKPIAEGCGCRADGFRCQAHAKPLAQGCGCRADGFRCQAHSHSASEDSQSRRSLMQGSAALAAACVFLRQGSAEAAGQPQPEPKVLCESDCQTKLADIKEVKTASGLRYKDLVVGKGPTPPTGYQVVADYVAMTPDGKVFDSSVDKGRPYDLRVGSGQIVPGLDEGVSTMRAGGLRRIYVPGNLSFPKGLPSGPGRPRVPPASPVMFDVKLLFIPGLEDEEE